MNYKPYNLIKEEYLGKDIPYNILLNTTEWESKRQEIIQRENYVCQVCKCDCMSDLIPVNNNGYLNFVPATLVENSVEKVFTDKFGYPNIIDVPSFELKEQKHPKIPHVHHTYYILNKLPWEYPNEDLMLVCHECHIKIHETENIPVYKNELLILHNYLTPCFRCNGTGSLDEYSYWQNGICFRCNGARFEEWTDII